MQEVQPDEIYNLAAQSHVAVSFETPEYTANADALGTLRLLEAIRILGLRRRRALLPGLDLRAVRPGPGDAADARRRRSIRAAPTRVAKLYAYWITVNYREAYGMYASQRHPVQPRSRRCAARPSSRARSPAPSRAIKLGLQERAVPRQPRRAARLGPCARLRRGQWLMLQQDEPDDYVIATGETHSVREFVELAFDEIGSPSNGAARATTSRVAAGHRPRARRDRRYYLGRPRSTCCSVIPARRAKLGWRHRTSFDELVAEMVEADIAS